jgi:hypothetical protein
MDITFAVKLIEFEKYKKIKFRSIKKRLIKICLGRKNVGNSGHIIRHMLVTITDIQSTDVALR